MEKFIRRFCTKKYTYVWPKKKDIIMDIKYQYLIANSFILHPFNLNLLMEKL